MSKLHAINANLKGEKFLNGIMTEYMNRAKSTQGGNRRNRHHNIKTLKQSNGPERIFSD